MADPYAAGLGSTVHVVAKRDFLESLAAARPIVALAELIWNGFDAEATSVDINLDYNELGGLECIRVKDNGTGIDHTKLPELFGSLGDSWKKRRGRINGRAMHGKSGKGRFKAFALGQLIEWSTTYRSDGHAYTYTIRGDASALDDFEVSELSLTDSAGCGTEVSVYNIRSAFRSLQSETALRTQKVSIVL